MKTRHYLLSVTMLAIQVCGFAKAQAQEVYEDTYYTRETVRRCRNQTDNTLIGGGVGTAIGAVGGALFGGGRLGPTLIGAAAGGISGALIGNGLSCQDETRYMENVEEHLSRPNYRESSMYEDDHLRCVILRSGYTPNREICRTYRSEILTPRGWVEREDTACYVNGMWRHGYDGVIITQELWRREPPPHRPQIIVIARPYRPEFRRPRYDNLEARRFEHDREHDRARREHDREHDRRERDRDHARNDDRDRRDDDSRRGHVAR